MSCCNKSWANHPAEQLSEQGVETGLSFETGSETFQLLADHVGRFIDAWSEAEEQGPPVLEDYLPSDQHIRLLVLIELIKVDLEARWQDWNLPKSLLEYVDEFPELSTQQLPSDLIYEEFHLKCEAGLEITPEEIYEQYPDQAASLKQYFAMNPKYHSTLIAKPDECRALDDIAAGQTIDDFALMMGLGQGAFAKVFLARQVSMQRLVAVKISSDKGTEPQTLAQLDHDYIVRVFDQHVIGEDRLRLLYMQYLPGGTLQSVVKRVRHVPVNERSGQLLLDVIDQALDDKGENRPTDSTLREKLRKYTWPEAVAWLGSRIALALDYAARKGVLHRDIKPANVLLTAEGVPKLADFNISFSSEVAGDSAAAYFGGSLAYMSPEQLKACHPSFPDQAGDLDGRSDLYSLAVMLWELLTGTRPFLDFSFTPGSLESLEAMIKLRFQGVQPGIIEQLPPDTPNTLRRVLLTSLEPDPERRWTNAAELSQQFEICLQPRARDLIDPPDLSWMTRLRNWTVPIIVGMNVIPNLISAVTNYTYNRKHIVESVAPKQLASFDNIQAVINGIAFPVGISIMIWLAWRVQRSLTDSSSSKSVEETNQQRSNCLKLGEHCALTCLSLWLIAGIAYPVSMSMVGAGVSMSDYFHFFSSLLICGLIATAYPFFGATLFSTRIYPVMLQLGGTAHDDRAVLNRLRSRLRICLLMAASIPLLTISAIIFSPMKSNIVLQAVCFGGFIAFGAVYWIYRQLEDDLEALTNLVPERNQNR